MNTFVQNFEIILAALCAGTAVLLSHVALGREVLKRGIIFIDLAIAQFAGFGIILASFLGMHAQGWQMQAIAFISAMSGAALLAFTEKMTTKHQEAFIGILFVLAATGSILLLASNPHANETLKDLLVGQILWVNYPHLILPTIVGLSIFVAAIYLPKLFTSKFFYFLFAIAITSSVQIVGIYLVFSSLIIPALVFLKSSNSKALLASLCLGISAYAIGLYGSTIFDLPSGPFIVWSLAACALLLTSIQKLTATNRMLY